MSDTFDSKEWFAWARSLPREPRRKIEKLIKEAPRKIVDAIICRSGPKGGTEAWLDERTAVWLPDRLLRDHERQSLLDNLAMYFPASPELEEAREVLATQRADDRKRRLR